MSRLGMKKIVALFRNRNFILILALVLGLFLPEASRETQGLTLPALAVVMTLSTLGVSGSAFRSARNLLRPALVGIGLNYLVLGGAILILNAIFIRDKAVRDGFVLLAAVPPAVAVVPYTFFLDGDNTYSFMGTMGAYLAALVLAPLMGWVFFGSGFVSPLRVLTIMAELIIAPLLFSRVLIRIGLAPRLERVKGTVTNWSFFLLTYTIVGLNREVFIREPLFLVPIASIAVASTFLLGWVIGAVARSLQVNSQIRISMVLLGTLKNYGLAGGLALALFNERTALPATVSTVFMIVYVIWLEFNRVSAKKEDRV